jgi:type IV secretion system protein VirB5
MKLIVRIVMSGVASLLLWGNASAQGIPVIDAANLVNSLQQVMAWGQQFEQMKNQIANQQQMYNSMNGSRGMGSLMNDPSLRNALPGDWQKVYTSIQSGGYSGLTGSAKTIRDATKIYDCKDKTGDLLTLCNQEMNKGAQDEAYAQQAYASAQARVNQIQGLTSQIDATSDPKAIADLNARIQAEQASIQNEQTKLQMFKMLSEAEDRKIVMRKREIDLKGAARTKTVAESLTPLQF